jgi:beta-N-acetylhexosaminidase
VLRHAVPLLSLGVLIAAAPVLTPPRSAAAAPVGRTVARDTVEQLLAALSTRQKVAQLVMPWLLGDYTPADAPTMRRARMWVDSLEVGGIIISTGTPHDIATKLNALQTHAPLPLLISADFEAGTTMRMAAGTPFPTQMGIGATNRPDDAYTMGRVTALEARAVGVHLAFAPVADVNSNPANPIINTRSFGGDPHEVARFVAATIRGMRDGGVLSTAKHFPGHGDTDTDSHLALPIIRAPWERFDAIELVPFRAAVEAGVDAIMSAHIAVPALDGQERLPGTLSPKVLTGILQDSLGFTGLITTDALDMGAIAKEIGADEGVIRAFEAGSDLLLMPADPAAAIDAMTAAVESGRISVARLDHSVRKVLQMKVRMGLFHQRTVTIEHIAEVVGTAGSMAAAADITERSLVLLDDTKGTVEALRRAPQRVAVITVADGTTPLGTRLAEQMRAMGHTVTAVRIPTTPTPAELDAVERAIKAAPYLVLATSVRWGSYSGVIGLAPATAELLNRLARQKPSVLVSFGSPYIIAQVPSAGGYLMAWSGTLMAETAVARALAGRTAITGTSPIPVPPTWPLRAGLQRPVTQ